MFRPAWMYIAAEAVCKESSVRYPGASRFCFNGQVNSQFASEVFLGEIQITEEL